jgi:sugar phosphate isomerase/epimerase
MAVEFWVFTKPWRRLPLRELGALVRRLGFAGVELPVRPGFQVEPERAEADLPEAVRTLAAEGVRVGSVAAPLEERTVAAAGRAGVRLLRTMVDIPPGVGYRERLRAFRRQLEALEPALRRHGVAVGIQNHAGRYLATAAGLAQLLEGLDPERFVAVWDVAHWALGGEPLEFALDLLGPRVALVNLKNAFWRRTNGPEAEAAAFAPYWTSGRHGLASWPEVFGELARRGYAGPICLTAEYQAENEVERLAREDLAWAAQLAQAVGLAAGR